MRPVFIARNVLTTGYSKIVKEQHIRFSLKQDNIIFTGIGFNMADKFHLLQIKTIGLILFLQLMKMNGTIKKISS